MAPFGSFVDLLTEIEDPRRAEGKLYRLPHVVLFAILAIVAGQGPWRGGLPRPLFALRRLQHALPPSKKRAAIRVGLKQHID